uniref:Retrovirus-related Pol polyprotein from transposon 17.6 n=1 Tax=Cajanus cajan TaxID=3821 RepID=A0A151QKW4_CAJCA|nr:Retrovirus-related Pol polyprotein from transposon 17.6 [Cajanus cajan]
MPFGLCNAPGTFQRCMLSIFSDFLENCIEVFMDDFTVYGSSFDACLDSLDRVLNRCIETNLVLNFEKCHFMVEQGIVLGHIISSQGIQVDPAKIFVIARVGGSLTWRQQMPQQPMLFCEVFNVWGIDFMGPFPISFGFSYILLTVDYVSKWVEAKSTRTNDARVIVDFVRSNIFYKFGVPRAIISDHGTHFCNRSMQALLKKYRVVHIISTPYHP